MNTKNSNILLLILATITVLLAVILFLLFLFPMTKEISATEIYTQCTHNVVEIKACADDIGDSFGTGEILTSDGKIVTNAHVVTYTHLGETHAFSRYSQYTDCWYRTRWNFKACYSM